MQIGALIAESPHGPALGIYRSPPLESEKIDG
jgi:hypothetical protein